MKAVHLQHSGRKQSRNPKIVGLSPSNAKKSLQVYSAVAFSVTVTSDCIT
jgi:hypothetical protein